MDNDTSKEVLKSLEDHYLKKDYDAAIDTLIKSKGAFGLGHFHYNLGTVYLKKNELGPARYNLEMAIHHGFKKSYVYHNIDVVKSMLKQSGQGDDLSIKATVSESFVNKLIDVPHKYYASTTLILLVLLIVLKRMRILNSMAKTIMLVVIAVVPVVSSHFIHDYKGSAVALKEVAVREGPSEIYEEIYRMSSGTKILFNNIKDDWLYISHPSALKGWVKKQNLATF